MSASVGNLTDVINCQGDRRKIFACMPPDISNPESTIVFIATFCMHGVILRVGFIGVSS